EDRIESRSARRDQSTDDQATERSGREPRETSPQKPRGRRQGKCCNGKKDREKDRLLGQVAGNLGPGNRQEQQSLPIGKSAEMVVGAPGEGIGGRANGDSHEREERFHSARDASKGGVADR